ncbi:septum formation initiator family protein [Neobacillus sp. PS3-40]|uniref:FtsB family cell division protein n=1 Tax=Neobacillus sp. PS3-40 TaxID=3070679 RepID=UPI0027DEDC4F|nr:septum formation initiator family protein [Neobacillus sp. PS3-40]WML42530.1 septum formation initiator family protein [Neobacillus sp. PS3-40]
MSAIRKKNVAKIHSTYVQQQEFASLTTVRKRKLLFRRLSIFLLFAAFTSYFMISSILSQTSALDAKMAQKKHLDKEFSGLKKQQQILKENIIKLNDDEYIAKLARKEYFFSDKNEVIFNIPDNGKGKSTSN